jgi:hypothetical protein
MKKYHKDRSIDTACAHQKYSPKPLYLTISQKDATIDHNPLSAHTQRHSLPLTPACGPKIIDEKDIPQETFQKIPCQSRTSPTQ